MSSPPVKKGMFAGILDKAIQRPAAPPSQSKADLTIDNLAELSALVPCADIDAARLMDFTNESKKHPFIIADDLTLYVVADATPDEAHLLRNARQTIRAKRLLSKTPDAPAVELKVSRNVLESWIERRNQQTKEVAEGGHVQKCESILARAVTMKATDIHIDTTGDNCIIRYRVNGILLAGETISATVGDSIINAIWEHYVNDGMRGSIAKDGRFERKIGDGLWLFRVSSGVSEPTRTKSMAIRARNMHDIPNINTLGYNNRQLEILRERQFSAGMTLICGSVNSGKSTLQLSLMAQRPADQLNLEISDQVEVILPHFIQLQKPVVGDEKYLSSQLPRLYKLPTRHDINFMSINEIRDNETASLMEDLMQLGTPGISSIHAKGWAEALNRLKGPKMQVSEDALYGEGFFNIIAYQTLGRVLCDCKLTSHPEPVWNKFYRSRLGDGLAYRNPNGCTRCKFTGIKGLTAVAEFIPITETNRHFLKDTTNSQAMRNWMKDNKVPNIHQHALEKIHSGIIDAHMIRPSIGDFSEHNLYGDWRG